MFQILHYTVSWAIRPHQHDYAQLQLQLQFSLCLVFCAYASQWSQMAKTRQIQIQIDLQHFRFRSLHALHFQNLSNRCTGISMICQFHDFFESHFWRVFAIQPICAPTLSYTLSPPLMKDVRDQFLARRQSKNNEKNLRQK